jgi:hypothetical protein
MCEREPIYFRLFTKLYEIKMNEYKRTCMYAKGLSNNHAENGGEQMYE